MKYRVIKSHDEITVITEDGGIACIRDVDNGDEGAQSVTDYYQDRFDQVILDNDTIWDTVGQGKMYCEDWTTPFDDPAHVQDALQWLSVGDTYELDETIWKDF